MDAITKAETVDKIQAQMKRDQYVAQDRTASADQRAAARIDLRQQSIDLPHAQVASLDASKSLQAASGSADQRAAASAFAQLRQFGGQLRGVGRGPSDFEDLDSAAASLTDDVLYISEEYATGVDTVSSSHFANALRRLQTLPSKAQSILGAIGAIRAQYGITARD